MWYPSRKGKDDFERGSETNRVTIVTNDKVISPRAEELKLLPILAIAQNIKSPSFVSGLKV